MLPNLQKEASALNGHEVKRGEILQSTNHGQDPSNASIELLQQRRDAVIDLGV